MSAEQNLYQDQFNDILTRLHSQATDWVIPVFHTGERRFNLVHRVWVHYHNRAEEFRDVIPVLVLPDGSGEGDIARDTFRAISQQTNFSIPAGTSPENILMEAVKQIPQGQTLVLFYPDANDYVQNHASMRFLRNNVPVGAKAVLATGFHEDLPFPIKLP